MKVLHLFWHDLQVPHNSFLLQENSWFLQTIIHNIPASLPHHSDMVSRVWHSLTVMTRVPQPIVRLLKMGTADCQSKISVSTPVSLVAFWLGYDKWHEEIANNLQQNEVKIQSDVATFIWAKGLVVHSHTNICPAASLNQISFFK